MTGTLAARLTLTPLEPRDVPATPALGPPNRFPADAVCVATTDRCADRPDPDRGPGPTTGVVGSAVVTGLSLVARPRDAGTPEPEATHRAGVDAEPPGEGGCPPSPRELCMRRRLAGVMPSNTGWCCRYPGVYLPPDRDQDDFELGGVFSDPPLAGDRNSDNQATDPSQSTKAANA